MDTSGLRERIFHEDQHLAAIKTYNYLRLGMLVAVAAVAYSVIAEYRHAGVHCFLGSISGYYYSPVHPVFVGVMIAVGLALLVIKGNTAVEDACLSFAGMLAPVVALVPTTDDVTGVCRAPMLAIGHYQPDPGNTFLPASINNNLHTLVWCGYAAIGLLLLAVLLQWRLTGSAAEYTRGFWINLAIGGAAVVMGSVLLHWHYEWVLDQHATAACLMFGALAVGALANSAYGFLEHHTSRRYAWTYLVLGVAMVVAGLAFLRFQHHDRAALGGHLVLGIEAIEIALFGAFWIVQTFERWNRIAAPRPATGT